MSARARRSRCRPALRGARAAGGARAGARRRAPDGRARRRRRSSTRASATCPSFLRAGDLLVVNTSATLPAALPARRADGTALRRCTSRRPTPGGARRWVVELRRGGARFRGARAGERLALPGGGSAELRRAVPVRGPAVARRAATCPRRCSTYLAAHGAPIRYAHQPRRGRSPTTRRSSRARRAAPRCRAPGRPFTARTLARARRARRRRRADRAAHRASARRSAASGRTRSATPSRPRPPRASTPPARAGGRVIAVGTTVTRALETVAAPDGTVRAARGLDRAHRSRPSAACAASTG